MEWLIILLTVLAYVLAAGIVLGVQALIAVFFAKCAKEKGYNWWTYFFACFFLGMIGYVIVAALPDKMLNDSLNRILSQNAE